MRWALIILLSFIGAAFSSEEDSNEVIIAPSSTKSPINLDTNLRKALLKALVELENEEKDNLQRDTRNDYVNIITHLDTNNHSVEKASASSISFFSRPEPVNMTITVKKSTSKPKQSVVVQRSEGSHKTIHEFESDSPEQIIASASNSFASSKSEKSKTIKGGAQLNSLSSKTKTKKDKYEQTTTTKPTSSTEESEANVESLQFFSAPLVAAFTVHQDEKGLPKSVVPIYNQRNVEASTTEKAPERLNNQEELQREVLKQQEDLKKRQEEELRTQQLKLEEEIKRLTRLREEQESLLREQKQFYEQNFLEQHKKFLEERTRQLNNINTFNSLPPTTTTLSPDFRTNFNSKEAPGTLVTIQPSVGFLQPFVGSTLPQNAQILPIKNPVDFRTPFPQNFGQFEIRNSLNAQPRPTQAFVTRSQPLNSFVPSVQTSVAPLVSLAQNPGFFQSLPSSQTNTIFHQAPSTSLNVFQASQNLPFSTSQNIPFRNSLATSPSSTRTLRQESGTGNFLNNRFNAQETSGNFFRDHRFNTNAFSQQFPRNSFGFNNPNNQYQYNTVQYSVDQPSLNQRFNNLLLNTGLGQGRQQENLNIVSKVLSLNHLGTDSQNSNVNNDFSRIRASPNWRVV